MALMATGQPDTTSAHGNYPPANVLAEPDYVGVGGLPNFPSKEPKKAQLQCLTHSALRGLPNDLLDDRGPLAAI